MNISLKKSNPTKLNNNIFAKQKIPFIVYLFCLFFAPPIIPHVNFILFVFLYSVIALFLKPRNRRNAVQVIQQSKMNLFVFGFLFFLLYLFIIVWTNIAIGNKVELKEYLTNFYRFFLIVPVILTCTLYVLVRCKELDYDIENFLFALILAGTLQGLMTFLAFAAPDIRQFFIMTMKNNTGETVFFKPFEVKQRFFGFANDMLDGFGYGVGILAALPFFLSFYTKKIYYLLFAPILILVPFLNVRTGLVIFSIGFLFSLPLLFEMDKKIRKHFLLVFLILVGITIIMCVAIFAFYPATMKWVVRDFVAAFKFIFTGQNARIGTNSVALWFSGRFFVFPRFPFILFGTGHTIYSVNGFAHSDIGYINDLWLVGIVGCIILYGIYGCLFARSLRFHKSKFVKYMIVFLIISLLVFQLKGRAFMANLGMILTLLISFYLKNNSTCTQMNGGNKEERSPSIKNKQLIDNIVISVVIPVYNVEKYLCRCIDSILEQSYKNLEIILIDDGSSDNSPKICDQYAKKDKRIKVIHKINEGVSAARNDAINIATGKYIAFVDSDDYVHSDFIKFLFNAICKYDADISVCSYWEVFPNNRIMTKHQKNTKQIIVMNNIEALKDIFTLPNYTTVVVWNKLYKTSLFKDNHIKYPINRRYEDDATTYKLYYYARKIVFFDEPLYYYLQNDSSFIRGKINSNRLDILKACSEIRTFVKGHNIPLLNEMEFNEVLRLFTLINLMVDKRSIDLVIWNKIRSTLLKNKRRYMKNPYMGIKQKIALYALNLGNPFYIFIRKTFVFLNNITKG